MGTPTASEVTHAVMREWRTSKPVVGLMGEFSSGKSTLLNFILQQEIATTKVTATPLPPIWFTYSDEPFAHGLREDGTIDELDLTDTRADYRETYLAMRRGLDCAALQECDIVDCPGISDPDLGKAALRFLQSYFDFVIWCTGASQAWRQTDKVAFEKLAKSTRDHSILVVTRIDKLRNATDRDKVMKRVRAETSDLFGYVLPLATPKASAVALQDRNAALGGAWVETGGFDFATAFATAVSNTSQNAASDPKRAASKSVPATAKKGEEKSSSSGVKDRATDGPREFLQSALEFLRNESQNGPYLSRLII